MHYTLWTFLPNISYIVYDLNGLRVTRKIQVIDFLQLDDLLIVGS